MNIFINNGNDTSIVSINKIDLIDVKRYSYNKNVFKLSIVQNTN
ncbi:hypothetical protein [Candidatus Kinetoplastidibacterium desouzai]|nr:hypothetical protein [Candidatus Kinetoplastibacterium desouzaii]